MLGPVQNSGGWMGASSHRGDLPPAAGNAGGMHQGWSRASHERAKSPHLEPWRNISLEEIAVEWTKSRSVPAVNQKRSD